MRASGFQLSRSVAQFSRTTLAVAIAIAIFLYHTEFSPFVLLYACHSNCAPVSNYLFVFGFCHLRVQVTLFADESPKNMQVLNDNCLWSFLNTKYNEGVKRVGVTFRCPYLMCGVVCEV